MAPHSPPVATVHALFNGHLRPLLAEGLRGLALSAIAPGTEEALSMTLLDSLHKAFYRAVEGHGRGCFEKKALSVGDIIWFHHPSSRKSDVKMEVVSYYKRHGKARDLVRSTTIFHTSRGSVFYGPKPRKASVTKPPALKKERKLRWTHSGLWSHRRGSAPVASKEPSHLRISHRLNWITCNQKRRTAVLRSVGRPHPSRLPGVGDYTARAILSIGFGQPK